MLRYDSASFWGIFSSQIVSEEILSMIAQDLSVSKFNQLHFDIFSFYLLITGIFYELLWYNP